jgi:hypothetical protein
MSTLPWFQQRDSHSWSTEISDFGSNIMLCPKCGVKLVTPPLGWKEETGHDGDAKIWIKTHSCGAVLTVFND